MKKGLLCLFAAALLFGCSGQTSSSSLVPSSDPASTSDSGTSSSEESSSDSASSSSISEAGYSQEELTLIHGVIGEHDIPYLDLAQYDEDYVLGTTTSQSGNLGIGMQAYNFPVEDIDEIIAAFVNTGDWADETEEQKAYYAQYGATWPEGAYYLYGRYEDTSEMEIVLSVLNPSTGSGIITEGTGLMQLLLYPLLLATSEYVPEDINTLVSEVVGATVSIPTPPEATYYMAYTIEEYAALDLIGVDAVDSYAQIFLDNGYVEIDNMVEDGRYLYSSNGIGVYLSNNIASKTYADYTITYCYFTLNTYLRDYPAAGIETMATAIGGYGHSLIPAPEGDFLAYGLEDGATDFGYGFFYCYGENVLDSYFTKLKNAGWTDVGYFKEYGVPYWKDPASTLILYARYDTTYSAIVVGLVALSEFDDMHKGWPSDVLADALVTIGSESSLPTPSFAVSYSVTADYLAEASYFYLAITNPDRKEEENWVDVSTQYKEDLVSAGWIYDSVQDVYASPDKKASATVYYDEAGTIVILQAYEGTLTSWPSESVASAITAMGITSSLPEVTATGYYYLEEKYDGTVISIEIGCYGLTEAQYNAYRESIIALGYEESLFNGVSFLYSNDALITLSYTSDRGLLVITLQNVSTVNISGSILNESSIMNTARTDAGDSAFVLPALPEGTIGIATYTNQIYYAAFTVVVFDDAFMDAYAQILVASGWSVKEYEDAAPTYSITTSSNVTWYISMYSYPEENYSTLALTVDL